jgi:TPR repeat protein
VIKNKSKALVWYIKAAEQGDSDAKNAVNKLERKGYSVHGRQKPRLPNRMIN